MPKTNSYNHLQGWIHNEYAVKKTMETLHTPAFGAARGQIKESGKGKTVLLYNSIVKLLGQYNVRRQDGPDCVAFGAAAAIDNVKATEIIIMKQFEEWVAETTTEDIYGGSRVNVGNGELGTDGGSYGAWAAKYVQNFGTLVRIAYPGYDLTHYDYRKSYDWGMPGHGVPQALLDIAKAHPIKTVSLVTTYEEVRDAIANGYAVTIASNQGFDDTRDDEGFAAPTGTWGHQMCLVGIDDTGEGCSKNRPGALCVNSWGVWNSGPKRHDQPDGSFWIDADVLEQRILSMNDSWAYSDYIGFPPKQINLRIF